jgi:NADH-quinone oxidoreductase subunit L
MDLTSPIVLAGAALFVPVMAFAVLVFVPWLRHRGAPAMWLSVFSATIAAVAASVLFKVTDSSAPILLTASWLPEGGGSLAEVGLRIDGISTAMLVIVTWVAWAVQVFSIGYMHDETPPAKGRYFAYHSLFIFSMNLLVLAPNLLQLFVGWELVGLTSYLLIGFYYQKPSAAHAAIKAFWVTKFADMGLLLGLLVLFVDTGSFAFDATGSAWGIGLSSFLLFVAVMGKSAQFPLHVWLPNAMEGPTPVSALLHAATMVAAGVFLLVRSSPLFLAAPLTLEIMLWVGSITAVFAAFIALFQTDIKRVLAYSTCSQLGYMVAAIGAAAPLPAYFHLTTHAFFKALLFLGAGSVIHAVHSNELKDMGGLAKKMPVTAVTFSIGALALAGLPGLSGFFSKDLILEAVAEANPGVPFIALLLAAFLTAFYMAKITLLAFFGKPSASASHAHESGPSMLLPLVALAGLAAVSGYFGGSFFRHTGGHYHFHLGQAGMLGTGLGLLGLVLSFVVYGAKLLPLESSSPYRFLEFIVRSRAIDRTYEFLFRSVVLQVARAIGWLDRYVIDGVMNWLAWISMAFGRKLQRLQSGNILDYLVAVAAGAVALAAWGLFS